MKSRNAAVGKGVMFVVSMILSTQGALCLTDEEIFRDFRFNFINPGARSLGLGGAFIAAADDATAAQANPAALNYITRNEFFAEYRLVQPDAPKEFSSSGVSSDSSGNALDLTLTSVTKEEDTSDPTFLSFAIPFPIGSQKARMAFSRQVVLNVQNSLSDPDQGLSTALSLSSSDYPDVPDPVTGDPVPYFVQNKSEGTLDTEILHYNLGFSISIGEDFSVGLTANYATLDMHAFVSSEVIDPRGVIGFANPRDPDGDGTSSPISSESVIDDSDSGLGYTVGVHWHPDAVFPSQSGQSPLRFGFVYRRGAELSVPEQVTSSSAGSVGTVEEFENVVREPDRFGLGVSWAIGDHWVLALDGERIEYSDLLEGFRSGVNFLTSDSFRNSSAVALAPNNDSPEFAVDDANVVHAGAEFVLNNIRGSGVKLALSGGFFNAPDNRIRLEKFNSNNAEIRHLYEDAFRGGGDTNHYTAGTFVSFPLGGFNSMVIQAAGDFSDRGTEFVLSTLLRFGKAR